MFIRQAWVQEQMITLPSITWGACYYIAHLRYSTRLKAAFKHPDTHTCRHLRAAAYDALPSDQLWSVRVRRNPSFCRLRSCLPSLLIATFAPMCAARCQSLGNSPSLLVLHRKMSQPAVVVAEQALLHINPFRCSLTVRTPLLHLRYPDAAVYPSLCVLSGKLRYVTVCLGYLLQCMGSVLATIFRFASPGRLCP
jgi:hypothetical protein